MTQEQELRLTIAIKYESPFVRIADWLWKIHEGPAAETGPVRNFFACRAIDLDYRWRERYVRRQKLPHSIWKTRLRPDEPICVAEAVWVDDPVLGAGWAVHCLCGYQGAPMTYRSYAETLAVMHEKAVKP